MRPSTPRRRRERYDPDPSDTARARIARFIVADHPRGYRPCPAARWREYLDAIGVCAAHRCPWRHSPASGRYPQPHDFTVSWTAAHKHFLRRCRTGIWTRILSALRGEVHTRSGRRPRPTAAWWIPPVRRRPRWPDRAGSTERRRSMASNATCWSTPPELWSLPSSQRPTCRIEAHTRCCCARPNGSRRPPRTSG
jgi:hypothetical protein